MKSRLSWILLIFTGLTGYLLLSRYLEGQDKRAKVGKVLLSHPEDIDRIFIKRLHEHTTLVRVDKKWYVYDQILIPADQQQVERMLYELHDITVMEKVSDHLQTEPEYELNQNSLIAEFYASTKRQLRLQLGAIKERGGQYAALTDVGASYLIQRQLDIEPSESSWEVTDLNRLLTGEISNVLSTSKYINRAKKKRIIQELQDMRLLKRLPKSVVADESSGKPVFKLTIHTTLNLAIDLVFYEWPENKTYIMAIHTKDFLGDSTGIQDDVSEARKFEHIKALGETFVFEVPSYAVERIKP